MPSHTNGAPTVPLPNRRDASLASKPPVWPLQSTSNGGVPLPAKCDRQGRQGGVCCKELKDEDDRTLVNPDVVRDVVIGLSDGLTVPFALTAGLSSLGESRLVVLGGIAELIAGAISMGIGGFLASQAERDHYRFLKRHTSSRVLRSCEGEMEREVYAILGPAGVDERTSQAVTKCLRDVEYDTGSNLPPADEETQLLRWKPEMGLTHFLLKFGEGLQEVPTIRLYTSAITIGLGYLVGGIIPLLPYFFFDQAHVALLYSCLLTGLVLLIFGAIKARVTGAGRGSNGIHLGCTAAAAYAIVGLLEA
ncbi:VIT family-domain-containing protein [Melanogaster broomeanus]|nr:VIT family-domain-containing protein [Melanogaster broomeanus]